MELKHFQKICKKKNKSTEKKARNNKLSKSKNEIQNSLENNFEFQKPKIHKGIKKAVNTAKTSPNPSKPKTILRLKNW